MHTLEPDLAGPEHGRVHDGGVPRLRQRRGDFRRPGGLLWLEGPLSADPLSAGGRCRDHACRRCVWPSSTMRRTATDRRSPSSAQVLPFWKVLSIGLPAAVSTTVIQQLTPTYLHELGFDLAFGGFATAMFGWGSTVGPFVWTAIAHRKGDSGGLGLGLSAFHALHRVVPGVCPARGGRLAAVWRRLLLHVGLYSDVTLARESRGSNLGQRMALIVGRHLGHRHDRVDDPARWWPTGWARAPS